MHMFRLDLVRQMPNNFATSETSVRIIQIRSRSTMMGYYASMKDLLEHVPVHVRNER